MSNYYQIVNDKVLTFHKVVVYKFNIGDVSDPDVIVFQMLREWQNTEQGKFIMSNARQLPDFETFKDYANFRCECAVIAELEEKKLSEYILKWGINND